MKTRLHAPFLASSTIVAAALAASACGPSVHVRLHGQYPALDPDCCPRLVGREGTVPPGALLVADVGYGETGFSTGCSYPENMERLRRKACSVGADLVQIVAENHPNFVSTCYRVRAGLYRLGAAPDSAPQPEVPDADRARCRLLTRRFLEDEP